MLTVIRYDTTGKNTRKELTLDKLTLSQAEIFRTVVKCDPSARPVSKDHLYETPCYVVQFDDKMVCDTWSRNGIWIIAFVNDVLDDE